MRKFITTALAALTFAGGLMTATASDARDYGRHGYYGGYYGGRHYRHHNDGDAAIVAGIAGLAIGAALASSSRDRYYDDGYYRRGYAPRAYRGGYYYDDRPAYRRCRTTTFYDPYYDDYVRRTRCW